MDIQLHTGQLEVFNDSHKVRVLVCGRRWGKSRLTIYELLMSALRFPGQVSLESPETVIGVLPTLPMARKILWKPLVSLIEVSDIGKYVKDIRHTEFRIEFENRKPAIQIASALDSGGDRLRGMRLWFAALDEFQDYRFETFDKVIRPAMADSVGSRALITGTPKGQNNILFELFSRATKYPETYAAWNRRTWDNPMIPWSEVLEAKATLPPKAFRQEYCATFELPEGQIYSELDDDNLIDRLPNELDYTIMGMDFGDTNPAIVVMGFKDGRCYYLDGYNPADGQPVPQPVQDEVIVRLALKYAPRGIWCDPSRPSSIIHIRDLGKQNGLIGLGKAVAGFNRIEEGIEQIASVIYQKKLLFTKDTAIKYHGHVTGYMAYEMMSSYHRAKNNKTGLVSDQVEEGQRDHICDAIRYALATAPQNTKIR